MGVLLAMVAAGGAAAVVALPALRLRADYLAIATLALAVTLQIVTRNAQNITGGAIGITSVPPPILFQGTDASFLNAITMVGIGGFVLFALLVILQFMSESPWGRTTARPSIVFRTLSASNLPWLRRARVVRSAGATRREPASDPSRP